MFVPNSVPAGFNTRNVREVRQSVNIPVIAVGRLSDPYMAEDVVASGMTDMVAVGRGSLADPELPNKALSGAVDDIAPCIGCLQGCAGYLLNPKKDGISCMVNPFCGKEAKQEIKSGDKKRVVVVGGGPAGMFAAWEAARRGHTVTLFEKVASLAGSSVLPVCLRPSSPLCPLCATLPLWGASTAWNTSWDVKSHRKKLLLSSQT